MNRRLFAGLVGWRSLWLTLWLTVGAAHAEPAPPAGLGADARRDAAPLYMLVEEALRAHPAALAAQARAGAANAAESTARWQFFPTPYVSTQTRGAGNGAYYAGNPAVVTAGISQPLWTGGRLSAGLERARAGSEQAAAIAAQTRQQLAIRFIGAYGEWLAAANKLSAYETGRDLHQRLLSLVVRRVQEGLSSPSDQELADSRLASLNADLAATDTQARTALARLSQLIGRPLAAENLRIPASPLRAGAPLAELLDQARAQNPAINQYRAEVKAQRAAVEERQSDKYPDVTLRLEHQRGNLTSAGNSPGTTVFISINSRFGAGLSTLSAVDEARSREAAAEADVAVQEREVVEQILADNAVLAQVDTRRAALRTAIAASSTVLNSWDRQFLAGRKTWQDLMNSARERIQLEAQLADVDAAHLVASWRIALVSGGVESTLHTAASAAAALPPPNLQQR